MFTNTSDYLENHVYSTHEGPNSPIGHLYFVAKNLKQMVPYRLMATQGLCVLKERTEWNKGTELPWVWKGDVFFVTGSPVPWDHDSFHIPVIHATKELIGWMLVDDSNASFEEVRDSDDNEKH